MSSSFDNMHAAATLGLFNLVITIVGADIAPKTFIERTLWPQRNSKGSISGLMKSALCLSAGGPLHKTVIKALDSFSHHSLLKGSGKGHMLGTPFFPDSGFTYKLHRIDEQAAEQEYVRNGLLVRALQAMGECASTTNDVKMSSTNVKMRQRISVTHLELMEYSSGRTEGAITLDDESVDANTILTLIASEFPSVILACFTGVLWKPTGASIFLMPLGLKLLAAVTALQRETQIGRDQQMSKEPTKQTSRANFEIHIPSEGFQIFSGPTELILPFFRHYGHPIRCRWRELAQTCIVTAMGLTHTCTMAASILWMPLNIQATWICYQLYLLFTMLIVRYCGGEIWGTTEERLGQALAEAELHHDGVVAIKNRKGVVMVARIVRSYHGSYSAGKECVARIVGK